MTNLLKKNYICPMKVTTKQKIIDKAVELFNEKGYASVTLFEIAVALNMTRGNLTYHFKDKEILLITIADKFWSKVVEENNKTRLLPSFENLHRSATTFYKNQRKYAFIFLDYHVLNHPAIRQQFRKMAAQHIKENKATIAFSIAAGNMHPEPFEGIYDNLAYSAWMVSFYWLNQQEVLGEDVDDFAKKGEMKIWSLLIPHFTEKGLKAFRHFFGKDYLKKLGESFEVDISNYVRF